jgi:hypothetical protein
MNNTEPICTLCGQALASKLLNCPHRLDGDCPFEASISPPASATNAGCMVGVLLFLMVWLGGATIGFTSILFNSQSLVSSLLSLVGLIVFWGIGLIGLGFVLFTLFGKNITIYNPQTGVMAKYATILGRTLGGGVSSGWETLPPALSQLSLSKSLRYPASWSAWVYASDSRNSGGLATFICEVTLLALVAENRLELKKTTTQDTFLGVHNRQTQRYMFVPKSNEAVSAAAGVLEQKILGVFAALSPRLQSQAWIPGAPLEAKDIFAAIYDADKIQPERWLIDLVEADLIAHGAARQEKNSGIAGWLKSKVVLEPTHRSQLETEYQLLSAKYEQLKLSQPDFTQIVRADIEKAFKDRTESSD